jgi:hypothetical protein
VVAHTRTSRSTRLFVFVLFLGGPCSTMEATINVSLVDAATGHEHLTRGVHRSCKLFDLLFFKLSSASGESSSFTHKKHFQG